MLDVLEKELTVRVLLHKVGISKGFIMTSYIHTEKAKGGIVLPDCILEQQADSYANNIVQSAMEQGKLDELYNTAWERLADVIPDDFCIIE